MVCENLNVKFRLQKVKDNKYSAGQDISDY